ncbi:MAG: DUF433 domain-containing protein [Acidobacteria bacterium]|nr:DUF433 domain-containing protein [Acidobacteriota bacterium]MYK90133.1 DUF433 domain-containing protein [Acidobacteriota bacterium]
MPLSKNDAHARYEAGTIRWDECDEIERTRDRYGGAWRFRNTGVPVASLFEALATGGSTAGFAAAHETAHARPSPRKVLRFLADQLDEAYEATWKHDGPQKATPALLDGGEQHRDSEHDPDAIHWKHCGAAWRNAERMSGSWCIRNTRFPLSQLFLNLADEDSVRGVADIYQITASDMVPVLQFLADELGPHPTDTLREP